MWNKPLKNLLGKYANVSRNIPRDFKTLGSVISDKGRVREYKKCFLEAPVQSSLSDESNNKGPDQSSAQRAHC